MDLDELGTADRDNILDETPWEFLRPAWWLAHVLLIGGAVYLGYRLGRRDSY